MTTHRPPLAATLGSVCVLASCGLFGLTQDEANRLALYQENAARYYGAERYPQALDQVEKGLEIAPDDYKLLSTQAWCYLRQVEEQPGNLPRCERAFDRLYKLREPRDHGAPALLGQGETQKRLGLRHWDRARSLRKEVAAPNTTPAERELAKAEAEEHDSRAAFHFERARQALQSLIDSDRSQRIAHKQLMDIAAAQNNYEKSVEHGLACLEFGRQEQQMRLKQIRDTLEVQEERQARVLYQDLIDQELRVRTALAEMHYREEEFGAALEQLNELLTMDPTRSTDYYNRARVLEALQRDEDARRDYQKFLSSTTLPLGHEKVTRAFDFTRKDV